MKRGDLTMDCLTSDGITRSLASSQIPKNIVFSIAKSVIVALILTWLQIYSKGGDKPIQQNTRWQHTRKPFAYRDPNVPLRYVR